MVTSCPPFNLNYHPQTTSVNLLTLWSSFSGILCKWNHIEHMLLCLPSSIQQSNFEIHSCCVFINGSFFLLLSNIPFYGYTKFCSSAHVSQIFRLFSVFSAITNKAAMNVYLSGGLCMDICFHSFQINV